MRKFILHLFLPIQLVSCGTRPIAHIVGLQITSAPTKTVYLVGETFDPTGMRVNELLSDGEIGKEVLEYSFSPNGALTMNDKEITIKHQQFITKQAINVYSDVNNVSSIEKFDDGRTYLCVEGKPYVIRGAQLRVDGLLNRSPRLPDAPAPLTYEEMEKYFIAAKAANLNTIALTIQWSNIETEKDVYDFSLIDALLTLTNKYDLKCEFCWFASNMCGDSFEYQLPAYIYEDEENYPRINHRVDTWYSDMYGTYFYLKVDEPLYLAREEKVIKALMEHVYLWNEDNGKKNPLIGIQVHNETDGLIRWRRDQREIVDDNDNLMSYNTLWNMTLTALDNAGKAFKSSKYKLYTRCNMTTSYDVNEFPQCPGTGITPLDVLDLDGIDIIGSDPYVTNPTTINSTIRNYRIKDNYPHIAENMGEYSNSAALFLTAYQAGGSYMFYDLATPEYFMYIASGPYQMDQGIYNPDLTFKSHSEETFDIVRGIALLDKFLPYVKSCNFAIFNANSLDIKENISQTINTNNYAFTYECSDKGVAFAIEDGEYAYIYSNKTATISIDNVEHAPYVEFGHFKDQEFISEGKEYPLDKIYLKKNKLYRVKIIRVLNTVSSTTGDNV